MNTITVPPSNKVLLERKRISFGRFFFKWQRWWKSQRREVRFIEAFNFGKWTRFSTMPSLWSNCLLRCSRVVSLPCLVSTLLRVVCVSFPQLPRSNSCSSGAPSLLAASNPLLLFTPPAYITRVPPALNGDNSGRIIPPVTLSAWSSKSHQSMASASHSHDNWAIQVVLHCRQWRTMRLMMSTVHLWKWSSIINLIGF